MQHTNPFKKTIRPISILLVVLMLGITLPSGYASAALIGTETVMNEVRKNEARSYVLGVMAREDVRNALVAQGIVPEQARQRIDSLTDQEVISLAEKMEKLPAGGDSFGLVVVAAVIVFLVLLFTDIAGYTDIFPFVKK